MHNKNNNKIEKIFKKILKVKIKKNISIDNCVEWDSLNFAKILSSTEKEFGIVFSTKDIEKLSSLEHFKKIIKSKLK